MGQTEETGRMKGTKIPVPVLLLVVAWVLKTDSRATEATPPSPAAGLTLARGENKGSDDVEPYDQVG